MRSLSVCVFESVHLFMSVGGVLLHKPEVLVKACICVHTCMFVWGSLSGGFVFIITFCVLKCVIGMGACSAKAKEQE